ncbi:MAG: hypothetical protein J7J82_04635 [Staphylothermus sp.]|nr:hypothetical protein [Staphylothermus sp.]
MSNDVGHGEKLVRAIAVKYILDGEAEKAIRLLSRFYGVVEPKIKIGLPRKYKNALGCYDPKKRIIYLKSSAQYKDPFVILHEFYHHLRSTTGKHRGTEKNADRYALDSLRYYACLKDSLMNIKENK